MRILLITETVPYPLDTGGRIKTWHTLQALGEEHEIHCHAFVRTEQQREAAHEPLGRICTSLTLHLVPRSVPAEIAHLVRSLATGLPLTVARHYSSRVMTQLTATCRDHRIEAVYCDHLSTLEYGRRLGLPIIHDAHNVEHLILERYTDSLPRNDLRRPLAAREARLLRAYEARIYAGCALIFAVSQSDASILARLAPDVDVVPIPIGVAASDLTPAEHLPDLPEVLFVGAQNWPPNADAVNYFVRSMWPAVRQAVPHARLTVVGRGEGPLKVRCNADPSIRLTGWVEDVTPWFAQARVMVVPLRSGGGMRVKILDAFARGVPVVSTSVGVEGIDAVHGQHVLIADSPASFAEATARVLRDRPLAERLSAAARALVVERYDTRAVGRRQLVALGEMLLRPSLASNALSGRDSLPVHRTRRAAS